MLAHTHLKHKGAVSIINFPSVVFDNETAEKILNTRHVLETQLGEHHLYSDGSFHRLEDASTRMSFAVAYKSSNKTYDLAISGTSQGQASSTRAEITGLLAAILCCPRNHPAKIYSDDQTTVSEFSALVQFPATTKQYLHSPNADWWGLIKKAYVQQGRHITVQWVHGHHGVPGNVAADTWAGEAHTHEFAPWQINIP